MACNTRRGCSNCGKDLVEISILDRAHAGNAKGLQYTSPHATRGFWSGAYGADGEIESFMCPECGRVYLYARPKKHEWSAPPAERE
jgi:hypothetical protein